MKEGKTIVELAHEIMRKAEAAQDYVVDTRDLHMTDKTDLIIGADNIGNPSHKTSINSIAHRQIGSNLNIPAKYYDKMREEAPELLADNVNHWFEKNDHRHMVRTLDGTTRAFLSDRYRRIDNVDIASVILPILSESPEIRVLSTEITERRMYIQAVFPRIEREVKVGDMVQAGISITNSEVGLGGFNISPLVYRLVCLNGMIGQHAMKKHHIGGRISSQDNSYEVFSDETIRADDNALMLKVRDVVRSSMDEAVFEQQVTVLQQATQTTEIVNPMKSVEALTKKAGLSEAEGVSILTNLIKGGDLSKYGLVQAVTAVANTHESYDRAIDFEQLGGRVLDLSRNEWTQVAEAA